MSCIDWQNTGIFSFYQKFNYHRPLLMSHFHFACNSTRKRGFHRKTVAERATNMNSYHLFIHLLVFPISKFLIRPWGSPAWMDGPAGEPHFILDHPRPPCLCRVLESLMKGCVPGGSQPRARSVTEVEQWSRMPISYVHKTKLGNKLTNVAHF